jgi:hypothetical protein
MKNSESICTHNFIRIFSSFDNRLNLIFQKNTKFLRGGSVRKPKNSVWYEYEKRLVSKNDVIIEIDILYDKIRDDYLYYSYNVN